MPEQKQRSDRGIVQATSRDIWLLGWIADQYAVSVDQLTQLVEWYNQVADYGKGSQPLTEHGIRYLVDRWRQAGWVKRQKILAHMPPWIWLTSKGLRAMNKPYKYLQPGPGRLHHIYYTNAVRMHIEQLRYGEAQWVSERLINPHREAEHKRHRVDGEVLLDQTRIGIEVELSQKSTTRLTSILVELKGEYETVWYFVSDHCQQAVRQAISRVPGNEQVFLVYELANILK